MRDIQQVLVRWGGWSTTEATRVGWSPVAAGFSGLPPASGDNRLTCSDEDGLIVDLCVARLQVRGQGEELDYIQKYYMYGWSKREIARRLHVSESLVRQKMQVAESFIAGALEILDIQLDMDLMVKKQSSEPKTLVRCAKPVLMW
ncbi:antiterminator Q family protein [Xenorhabdus bovienii]|uniref:antiterminator Q family protein n=1 Tax=Xenorhabdus bovienii TaxID=40576 RepID=UPI0023B32F91|nr:antiterminator Q family protein [Xenorhabdus bovienii]MDE9432771.1 antitermination protein Q [Xenorhabdus bovienii]MDE9443432.1 antitermination protein Q [Xenorhabdus bovienii]MDE9490547.1 antitermination protein Q [Xenorhabdus bovienii]MDE9507238.1 antitermination protein Q [Xenorhabdus bovienii]